MISTNKIICNCNFSFNVMHVIPDKINYNHLITLWRV